MSEYIVDGRSIIIPRQSGKALKLEEIVRCRDCRKCNIGWCFHFGNVVKPDGFCAWGVRKAMPND